MSLYQVVPTPSGMLHTDLNLGRGEVKPVLLNNYVIRFQKSAMVNIIIKKNGWYH
jgi:hypothetical protein